MDIIVAITWLWEITVRPVPVLTAGLILFERAAETGHCHYRNNNTMFVCEENRFVTTVCLAPKQQKTLLYMDKECGRISIWSAFGNFRRKWPMRWTFYFYSDFTGSRLLFTGLARIPVRYSLITKGRRSDIAEINSSCHTYTSPYLQSYPYQLTVSAKQKKMS